MISKGFPGKIRKWNRGEISNGISEQILKEFLGEFLEDSLERLLMDF